MENKDRIFELLWLTLLLQVQLQWLISHKNGRNTAFKCQFIFMYTKNRFSRTNSKRRNRDRGNEKNSCSLLRGVVLTSYIHIAFITDGRFFCVLRSAFTSFPYCAFTMQVYGENEPTRIIIVFLTLLLFSFGFWDMDFIACNQIQIRLAVMMSAKNTATTTL